MPGSRPAPPSAVLESCLYASDLDAAEGFYGELLGLERVTRHANRHVFFRCGTQMVLIFDADETEIPSAAAALPVPTAAAPIVETARADTNSRRLKKTSGSVGFRLIPRA